MMITIWKIDPVHSYVGFRINLLGISALRGHFNSYNGSVSQPGDGDWEHSEISFDMTIDSIDTAHKMRDEHLQGDYFFDGKNYPTTTFKSTSLSKQADDNYHLSGELTLKGITKSINFNVAFGGFAKDKDGNEKAGFSATGIIKREDFGIAPHAVLPDGNIFLKDDVELQLDIQLMK
jgi:polyisoprenoid-binding protein YceI